MAVGVPGILRPASIPIDMKDSSVFDAILISGGDRSRRTSRHRGGTALVERAQRGDHEEFDALASAAYDRLFAIATRILRDPYAAEDAVQEALVRAWRALRGLRERER